MPGFKRSLTLLDAVMLVSGSMIGSGIFIVSADMMRQLGSPAWMLTAWVVAGVMTILAALSYGELAAMMPKAGGQYVYPPESRARPAPLLGSDSLWCAGHRLRDLPSSRSRLFR